jgi:hypothetical protein
MPLTLEKELYHEARSKGLTFGELLEELDPTQERDESGAPKGLDAYGRQLKRFDIKVSGPGASPVEKFFQSSQSAVLFPHFVETKILQGVLAASIVPKLIATETRIDTHNYDSVRMTDAEPDRQLRQIGEGAQLPVTTIQTADESIRLKKYGRLLRATYEALRRQKLNAVGIFLQRMGAQLGIDESNDALRAIIGGDGNAGTDITKKDADVSGTVDYDELVKLWLAFPAGYELNAIVATDTYIQKILNLSEFKDPMAGFKFQSTGDLVNPLGAQLVRWADAAGFNKSGTDVSDWIVGIDKRYCLEKVVEQPYIAEYDRLIDKQFERAAISSWVGWKKLDPTAAQAIDIIP